MKALLEGAPSGAERLGEEAFEHVKKFIGALAMAREDIGINLSHRSFGIRQVWLKNAFGEPMEIFTGAEVAPSEPVVLTSEDAMMMNVMLSSEPPLYKLLLMNARRLLDEEHYGLSMVTAVAGLDVFLNLLLRNSLSSDLLLDYTGIGDCSLYDRVLFLKKMAGSTGDADDTLGKYSGEIGQGLDAAIACYEHAVAGLAISAEDAEKSLKAISRAVYELKSKYGI